MRKLNEIDVPPRVLLYVIVGGAAAWLVHNDAITIAYVAALVVLVVWLIRKGNATGQFRR
jgi:hypothetical protein